MGKISKVKRSNKKHTKLARQGKLKLRRHKKPKPKPQQPQPVVHESDEEESDHGEDMLEMVEGNDLEFIKKSISENSYDILKKIRISKDDSSCRKRQNDKEKVEEQLDDDIEKAYHAEMLSSGPKRPRYMLPIKTSRGVVTRTIEDEREEIDESKKKITADDNQNLEEEAENEESDDEIELMEDSQERLDPSQPITTAQLLACRQEVLNERKYRIGILCSGILEDPENRIKNFQPLLDLMEESHPEVRITVRKLAAVSLLEVFKDLLPTYSIRLADLSSGRLKKSTLKLRKFEEQILSVYKRYLTKLEKLAKCLMRKKGDSRKYSKQDLKLGETAVQCMADLLVAHPYFNYSVNLSQYLVTFLDNHSPAVRDIARIAIQTVFKEDKRGEVTLQIVRRINGLIKRRHHNVHSSVLAVLLALRIRDVNLDKEKEDEMKQKQFKSRKMKLLTTSKRDRKREKKMKELESELLETKAEENKQRKQKHLTEVTKVVFMIYFRILKQDPNPKLLSVALEGLAKFAHCINLDFYHDLVNVLDELMKFSDLGYREQLHIVQTVFTILSGQGEMLTIDPCRFYTHFYRNLLKIHAGKSHSDMPILVKTVEAMLIKRRKKVSQQRLFAFMKRLATLALQLLHNGSLSCLGHIKSILQLNKSSDILLDVDKSGGQGLYDPLLEEPEYCNAGNAALWELSLLQRHYHPLVKKFANFVSLGAPATGNGSLSLDLCKMSAEDLFVEYDSSKMAFKPAIPPPRKSEPKLKPSKTYISDAALDEQVKQVMNSSLVWEDVYKSFTLTTG